jgi:glycogen debranching enzyme
MSSQAEIRRLREAVERRADWKKWGPYLPERQWATVREDYSANGDNWDYFPHDHARSRAYRWGEDGLLGWTDRKCRLAFAIGLWNGRDPFLKERLFGLTGPQGNHGEDVKELYYYLDATPTHCYQKALYKYPQAEFPYARLLEENQRRSRNDREFELLDSGIFDDNRYFDVFIEYAKASPEDMLILIRIENRGPEKAPLAVLPTLWFRNTWSWGRTGEDHGPRPRLWRREGSPAAVEADHWQLGRYRFEADDALVPTLLFTENETNKSRLWGAANDAPYVKDAFHRWLVDGEAGAVNPEGLGTKCAFVYRLEVAAGGSVSLRLRLRAESESADEPPFASFDSVMEHRRHDVSRFYDAILPDGMHDAEQAVARQAYAGLLWSKQFYYYAVNIWLQGDPTQPPPPPERREGRNAEWASNLYNRDVLSMPDKWEYPWYAAWDLAFHTIPLARVDPEFAKEQLILLLREWYMHPNGQVPAYEFSFSDVNPPVHAWAALRVYRMTGRRDTEFLERVFQKLLLNFTWWVNRTDYDGNNIFSGGFLGLDNIGVFDRSHFPASLGRLEQADATAWMAFYCLRMLQIAMELARDNRVYEDIASKFFEHFVAIMHSINTLGDRDGLWDEEDGFYYDVIRTEAGPFPLKVRSLVGILPIIAVEILEEPHVAKLTGFTRRMNWFLAQGGEITENLQFSTGSDGIRHLLLSVTTKDRLVRVLRYMLDEEEFLSPYGIRSVSRYHLKHPYVLTVDGQEFRVDYEPAESTSGMFGGNSNWRGPVWFPLNYLIIEALQRFHHFFGEDLQVECPTGSGNYMSLGHVAHELQGRLARLFLPGPDGSRPCHGGDRRFADDPWFKDLITFYEYFDGDDGRGLGASHQTGWTALVARCLERFTREERHEAEVAHMLGRDPSQPLVMPESVR